MYYAMHHTYGATTGKEVVINGKRHMDHIGTVYPFTTRAARAKWIAAGMAYKSQSGARTALTMADARDRRAIKAAKSDVHAWRTALEYIDSN